MTDINAICVTCKKSVNVKSIDIGTGCIQLVLSCGHERRIYIPVR